jgi:methyltransferase (TIGR00027 family)
MSRPGEQSPHRFSAEPGPPAPSLGSYADTEWDITTGVGMTALAVAAGRAVETARPDGLVSDPYAAAFVEAAGGALPLPTNWPPRTTGLALPSGGDPEQLDQMWATMASYMGVRSRFFDQYFHAACHEAGIGQVVLLAAGLDTRAHRLSWPEGTQVFEIDHPNVLAFKDHLLAERAALPRTERRPVGADLREDWPNALQQAGFDPGEPTAWLAEGLLFFLPDDAKQLLCERVNTLSAAGSRWAIETMADPAAAMQLMREGPMAQQASALFGADPSGLWPPDQHWEPQNWLIRQGWTVTTASAHTVAARHQRTLEGPAPMGGYQHPSVLLSAVREHVIAEPGPGQGEPQR